MPLIIRSLECGSQLDEGVMIRSSRVSDQQQTTPGNPSGHNVSMRTDNFRLLIVFVVFLVLLVVWAIRTSVSASAVGAIPSHSSR
jgi:hypothetical protein